MIRGQHELFKNLHFVKVIMLAMRRVLAAAVLAVVAVAPARAFFSSSASHCNARLSSPCTSSSSPLLCTASTTEAPAGSSASTLDPFTTELPDTFDQR
jgi:ABC-type phosphate transport system substrate-binding protein